MKCAERGGGGIGGWAGVGSRDLALTPSFSGPRDAANCRGVKGAIEAYRTLWKRWREEDQRGTMCVFCASITLNLPNTPDDKQVTLDQHSDYTVTFWVL